MKSASAQLRLKVSVLSFEDRSKCENMSCKDIHKLAIQGKDNFPKILFVGKHDIVKFPIFVFHFYLEVFLNNSLGPVLYPSPYLLNYPVFLYDEVAQISSAYQTSIFKHDQRLDNSWRDKFVRICLFDVKQNKYQNRTHC